MTSMYWLVKFFPDFGWFRISLNSYPSYRLSPPRVPIHKKPYRSWHSVVTSLFTKPRLMVSDDTNSCWPYAVSLHHVQSATCMMNWTNNVVCQNLIFIFLTHVHGARFTLQACAA